MYETTLLDAIYLGARCNRHKSSTEIRSWASEHWDYIPAVCKDYYIRKVLVLGGESTGKSTLVQNLALAYNTNFVSEVSRDTCEYAGGEELMIVDDLYENLLRQKINGMDAAKHSNRLLFVDTDAITTLFYSDFLLTDLKLQEKCKDLALVINSITHWDLILFLEPTVEFVQDGTRSEEIAKNRKKYSEQIKSLFKSNTSSAKIIFIEGDYLARFEKSKAAIKDVLNIDTKW